MSETPKGNQTPLLDLLRGVPADGRAIYEHSATHSQSIPYGRMCHEAADALTAERAARERAEAENNTLRGLLGNSGKPCAHCGLPVERWGECAHGFPGCARADDAQLSDLFAAKLAAEEMSAEVERLREALQRIRPYAEQEILDCAADIQEGGKGTGLDDWSAVINALENSPCIDTAIRAAKEGS